MKQFLTLTTLEGDKVIVGANNIALIEDNKGGVGALITFNVVQGNAPKYVYVQQTLSEIERMLGE